MWLRECRFFIYTRIKRKLTLKRESMRKRQTCSGGGGGNSTSSRSNSSNSPVVVKLSSAIF